jgi:hypothetical protein
MFDLPAEPTNEDLADLVFNEDGFFGALALTYVLNAEMQFRASVGNTTIRPDLREVAPATYIDPLTGFPIGGTPGIEGKDEGYEQPFHSLDMVYTYYPTFSSTLTFKVQNILGEDKQFEFEDILSKSETKGTRLEVALKWDF